jgi:predicted solute-binding protein
VRVARLKYSHSDPLFRYSGIDAISASNRESIDLLLGGRVDIAFIPLTYASLNCGALEILPEFAIFSEGPVISARLFAGAGEGYAAVSDTSVNAMALRKLMGLEFEIVDDPIAALRTHRGVLVIGDDALRLVDSGAPHLVDVGELWQRRVGLPLVYAVMAARRGVDARGAREIVRAIGASLERFRADPRELIAEVSRRIGVSGRLLQDYYGSIRYRVSESVMRGIEEELRVFGLPRCPLTRPRAPGCSRRRVLAGRERIRLRGRPRWSPRGAPDRPQPGSRRRVHVLRPEARPREGALRRPRVPGGHRDPEQAGAARQA